MTRRLRTIKLTTTPIATAPPVFNPPECEGVGDWAKKLEVKNLKELKEELMAMRMEGGHQWKEELMAMKMEGEHQLKEKEEIEKLMEGMHVKEVKEYVLVALLVVQEENWWMVALAHWLEVGEMAKLPERVVSLRIEAEGNQLMEVVGTNLEGKKGMGKEEGLQALPVEEKEVKLMGQKEMKGQGNWMFDWVEKWEVMVGWKMKKQVVIQHQEMLEALQKGKH
ncbi:putative paralemmin-3 [Sesbania bispinosa]|nr:putative paralemmin-3 [Sesbania bispinosa]